MYKGIETISEKRGDRLRVLSLDCNNAVKAIVPGELPQELKGSEQDMAFDLMRSRGKQALFDAHLSGQQGNSTVVYDCTKS
jgi:hypothetical protein